MNGVIKKIIGRIKNMISKAIINSVIDSGQIQLVKVQGLDGEVIDSVERLQNFGHTANPPEGSETILAYIGGNKDHPVAIVVDSGKYRVKDLKPGESAVYDKTGSTVYLKEDGSIVISPSDDKVVLEGDLEATGDIKDSKGTLDELRTEFNTFVDATYGVHVHVSAAPGSPTGPPTAP